MNVSARYNNYEIDVIGFKGFYSHPSTSLAPWHSIFGIWQDELVADKLPTSWESCAFDLYQAFMTTSRRFPNTKEQFIAFVAACLTLTCPMYYGLEPHVRRTLRMALCNDTQNKPMTDELLILQAEQLIWSTFAGELPVDIPLLYNLSDI